MIVTHQGKQYPSYVEIFLAMCNEDIPLNISIFAHSKYFYIRNQIKEKFGKEYSINTIKKFIRDNNNKLLENRNVST